MKSRRRQKKEKEAALLLLNSIVSRVSLDPLPGDVEKQMRGWERLVQRYSPTECDECRRVASADYNWMYRLEYAPILDPEKVRGLEGEDKSAFVNLGRGSLWTLGQRCEGCAS